MTSKTVSIPTLALVAQLIGCSAPVESQVVDPPGTMQAQVQADKIVLTNVDADWTVNMSVAGVGRLGSVAAPEAGTVGKDADGRTVVRRGNVTEWYIPMGPAVEQGFDIAQAPEGSGRVAIELSVSGDLDPWMGPGGVRFANAKGNVQMMYDSLEVVDADGAILESKMELDCSSDCVITLSYDDTGAAYPVTVDPLFYDTNTVLFPVVGFGVAGDADDAGWDIAIDGNVAVVGVPGADDPLGNADVGTAVVYDFNGTTWVQRSQLWGESIGNGTPGAQAGWSVDVAVDGANEVFAVGAPGSDEVFIFRNPSASAEFGADEILDATGGGNDKFGHAVALDAAGNTLAVGTPDGNSGNSRGEVWIFEDVGDVPGPNDGFQVVGYLEDTVDANNNEEFGYDVDISDDGTTIVVGVPGNIEQVSGDNSGAVFVFTGGPSFALEQIIEQTALQSDAEFGHAIAMFEDVLGIGAPAADTPVGAVQNTDAGAAYLYTLSGSSYVFDQSFVAPVEEALSRFGDDVAVGKDVFVVGHPLATAWSGVTDGGKVWIFNDPGPDAWILNQEAGGSTEAPLSAGEQFGFSVALGEALFVGTPDRPDDEPASGPMVLDGFEADFDDDGFLTDAIEVGGLCGAIACDCDDTDPLINPDAVEDEIDDVDENCDGFLAICETADAACTPFGIVITEVMAAPLSGNAEWIELYNGGTRALDFAGAFIRSDNRAHTIQDNLLLQPGEHALLVYDEANAGSTIYDTPLFTGGDPVDVIYRYDTVILPDEVSPITPLSLLSRNAAIDIDIVDYDLTFSTGLTAPQGATFTLDPDFTDSDANDTATYWCDARTPFGVSGQFGTPGAANDECDYALPVDYVYTNIAGGDDLALSTTWAFYFDDTMRWGNSGNGADFTYTRTTTSGAGQTYVVQYEDFTDGSPGVEYTGSVLFGDDCVANGTIANIPAVGDFGAPGTWSTCP